MATFTQIADSIRGILYSPRDVMAAQLDVLDQSTAGTYKLVDSTNPFVKLMEMTALVASSLKLDREVSLRRMYPSLSQDYDDLYHHMSDDDYIGRFSTPTSTTFNFLFRKDEVISKAVMVGDGPTRKLVIPRYTTVTIDDMGHLLTHPIEIRVLGHGGLQIVHDTSEKSPLSELASNVVDHRITRDRDGVENLMISTKLLQCVKTTYLDTINPSTGFVVDYEYPDKFYHCRVYGVRRVGNEDVYTEFNTTHSEMVYDITKVTALLKVKDGTITVEIPQVYFNFNMLPSKIRIDVFTTKGYLNLDLADYNPNKFSTEWGDELVGAEESKYTAPIASMSVAGAWSAAIVRGGSDGLSFDQLRDRVITASTSPKQVITDAELKSRMQLKGYDIVLAVDNMSDRVFYATRNLPPPIPVVTSDETLDVSNFITGAGCSIDTIKISMEEVAKLPYVKDNGNRITITPDALYQFNNGVVSLLPADKIPTAGAGGLDGLVGAVNSGNYAYSPFYYVLDASNNAFDCRAYHLDSPEVTKFTFEQENDTAGLQVSAFKYLVEKIPTGYRLLITTTSDDAYKELLPEQLYCQLSYRPPNESRDAFINGTLYGKDGDDEYVWEFLLETNHDIDMQDRLYLDNLSMYVDDFRSFMSELTVPFNIYFAVAGYTYFGMKKTDIDLQMGGHLFPEDSIGLTHQKMTVELGVRLKQLWVNGRTVSSSVKYKTYEQDVPYTYPETIYDYDSFEMVNGELVYRVIRRAGDPVIENGEIKYRHYKGDLVLELGEPVKVTDRKTLRMIDVFLVDGCYAFATYPSDVEYKKSIAESVISYIRDDLAPISNSLLQNTELYYYPKKTIGTTKMIIGNKIEATLPAQMSFTVRHYLPGNIYRDEKRREAIATTTSEVINRKLSRSTVSVTDLAESIKSAVGSDVMAIDMDKMGPFKDIAAYTALDDSRRCSVKRVLEVQPDNSLRVREDINIEWLRHVD